MNKPELTQQMIDRLRTETDYLHARSATIAVPLFVMKLVLDEAEQNLKSKHQSPNPKFQNAGEPQMKGRLYARLYD